MMKKNCFLILIIMMCLIFLTGCGKSDAVKFKEDYESLNGVERNGKLHRTVNINKDNQFVYTTGDEIVNKIEKKESFYLYVGDTMCPWCRSVIETFIKKANQYDIEKVYYINIWDKDHNEIFRDKYEIDGNGALVKTIDGTQAYNKILTYFDNLLSNYTITDSNGNTIETGEKRIFAPNFFYVSKGNLISLEDGLSEKQTDSRGELTEEILKDEEDAFDKFFQTSFSCTDDSKC